MSAAVLPATSAQADTVTLPSNSKCAQTAIGGTVTCTYPYTGAEQSFTVPDGITGLDITATGGSGGLLGTFSAVPAARGAVVSARIAVGASQPVQGGATLWVEVGGQGHYGYAKGIFDGHGGFNGGGDGLNSNNRTTGLIPGGGGGGGSDVRTASSATVALTTSDTRLIVAGAGGGQGNGDGVGGDAGAPGSGTGTHDGGAGTDGTGGAAGLTGGQAGGPGQGGAGADPAGGGGGGYYGGGGGGTDPNTPVNSNTGGGGGGSSYAPGGTVGLADTRGNGSVVISYSPGSASALSLSPASATIGFGSSQAYTATSVDSTGASIADVTAATTFTVVGPNNSTGTCTGSACTAAATGSNTVTGTDGGLSGTASLAVSKATASTSLAASPSSGQTYPGAVTLKATVIGSTGGPAPTGTVAFTATSGSTTTTLCAAAWLSTSSGVTSASCTPSQVFTPGTYSFSATYSGDGTYNAGSPGSITSYTVSQGSQTTVFGPAASTVEAGLSTTVTALGGSSSQPVVISRDSSSSAAACTVTSTGNGTASVQYTHPGVCVLDADQAGDGDYAAAKQAQLRVQVVGRHSSVTLSTPATAAFGQAITATATVSVFDGTSAAGTVQFSVAGSPIGSPVALDATGAATSPNLSYAAGRQLDPGSYPLDATFTPSSGDYANSSAMTTAVTVTRATTTTTVNADASSISATVSPVAPGASTPTGTVTFSVAGSSVGTAQLAGGVATLAYAVPADRADQLSAAYAGSTDFTGSSASTAQKDPTITATVTSGRARTSYGWYNHGVTVTFTCTTGSAPLTAACPAPATLIKDGAGQSVTRTIIATDGGTATASVTGLNLDSIVPTVRVQGVTNGGTVFADTTPTCAGTDTLSGIARCTITLTKVSRSGAGPDPTGYAYRVSATDKAGNTTIATGRYTSLGIYLAGSTYRGGVFDVEYGQSYPVTVTGYSSIPTFQYAVGYNGTPVKSGPKLTAIGTKTWAVTLPINTTFASRHDWNIGVVTGDGVHHVLHIHQ